MSSQQQQQQISNQNKDEPSSSSSSIPSSATNTTSINTTNKQKHTIDQKHAEMLDYFYENDNVILPRLCIEKRKLKAKLDTTPNSKIDLQMEIKDKIKEINAKIKCLKQQKTNYLLDNSKYVFEYFKEKKKISIGENDKKSDAVNHFFKIKPKKEMELNEDTKHQYWKKAYQMYWKNVNNEIINIQDFLHQTDVCEVCKKGEMIPQEEEGILICNNHFCGIFIPYIIDNAKPANKEPPNEITYTAYARLNHFKEILSQFQAKETTQISDEVIEMIKNRIKKERIVDIKQIDYVKMREILKTLNLNHYFEHIQYINSIFGIKPPIMCEELYETLCVLFIEIQQPWAKHCPANRSNFFNYTYTLYQLCVLLDQNQYLPFIPMLKDREKQLEQDMIWKKVCNELDWEYFATV
jgi:hypothetical protein